MVTKCYYWLSLSLSLSILGCDSKAPTSPPKLTVPVQTLSLSNVPITKEYIGITQSISSVDIRARVKGFLTKMNFVEGKAVKKDQLLFIIDPAPFEAKLTLAQGQLSSSIAQKEYQQVEYYRLKDLVAKGDVSKSNFDKVASQYSDAVGQVEVATAQVQEAKINLSYTSMYSPIDGIISRKYVDVGNLVGGGENTLLANVVQLNPIYVQFSPSVADYNEFLKYRKNMPFFVEASFPDDATRVFTGKMNLINNQADIPTSTIYMRATIDNPDMMLLPGIYVNIKLTLSEKNSALLVPIKATIQTQGQYSVFVVGQDNKAVSRVIQVSGEFNQQYVVKSGVNENERIVLDNLQKLRSGEEIIPKENAPNKNISKTSAAQKS